MEETPLMIRISEQGWALPQRLNFRYSYEQKLILYDIFMKGVTTGMKKSPEEVEIMIRKFLKPHQYVTAAQIRSLFSSFTRKLKEGSLKPPEPKSNDNESQNLEHSTQNINEEQEVPRKSGEDDKPDVSFHVELTEESSYVMSSILDWEEGDYVVVRYDPYWFPGMITEVCDDGLVIVSIRGHVKKVKQISLAIWKR